MAVCDTYAGDLTVHAPNVHLPRLSRVAGRLVVLDGAVAVALPALRWVRGLRVEAVGLVTLDLSALEDVCGGDVDVHGCAALPAFHLPRLGGAVAGTIAVTENGDGLAAVDLGSLGGGPRALVGTPGRAAAPLVTGFPAVVPLIFGVQGTETTLVRLTGMTALQRVESAPGERMLVQLESVRMASFPVGLQQAEYGNGSRGVGIMMFAVAFDSPTTVELLSVGDLVYVAVLKSTHITRFAMPHWTTTEPVSLIAVDLCPHLAEVDLGSVGGGPVIIANPFLPEMNGLVLSRWTPFAMSVRGLTALREVRGYVGHPGTRVDLKGLAGPIPPTLWNATYSAGAERLLIQIRESELPPVVVMPGVTDFEQFRAFGNRGAGTISLPNVGPVSVTALDFHDNEDLREVEVGTVGGGPVEVAMHRDRSDDDIPQLEGLVFVGLPSAPLTRIAGFGLLESIRQVPPASPSTDGEPFVSLAYLQVPSLPEGLFSAAFGVGAERVGFSMYSVTFGAPTEMSFPNATQFEFLFFQEVRNVTALRAPDVETLKTLEIRDTDLEVLRMPSLVTVQMVNVSWNPSLPKDCVELLPNASVYVEQGQTTGTCPP
eukprot:TRINITY_DN861_c0_g1_i10.p1 TRINITY_DN861_c0_g1~~TRINITY_DN861_c0_g1_i10.p1  ORF type:complete len:617 (+),score=147.32 TRINITY_DN861_c0_g1_i10:55-1851(+)